MRAMAAELNMFQAQVNEYKFEIERVTRELQDVKRKYFEQKRREQLEGEAQRGEEFDPKDPLVQQQHHFLQQQPKFVGEDPISMWHEIVKQSTCATQYYNTFPLTKSRAAVM
jgi:hypothetical protein